MCDLLVHAYHTGIIRYSPNHFALWAALGGMEDLKLQLRARAREHTTELMSSGTEQASDSSTANPNEKLATENPAANEMPPVVNEATHATMEIALDRATTRATVEISVAPAPAAGGAGTADGQAAYQEAMLCEVWRLREDASPPSARPCSSTLVQLNPQPDRAAQPPHPHPAQVQTSEVEARLADAMTLALRFPVEQRPIQHLRPLNFTLAP